ncbi:carotenoid biosynthesis protein [Alkalicoccus urumqiensis]|uniref:Carotenoid biosynthesis protein n=1 Tax=Alkalicoccus urumqiensis TaxID=1548213 RepID=A0A2P6MKF2_ALKUR|nr:carotenoid biosynthesis protein [Alkalicoccus urumqiensis]PRO66756.1 carotenoid biosynthesis protein [Alkalicoccus urumqiensis]
MKTKPWEHYLFRFFLIWYAIGVVLLAFDLVPPWLEWANVVFLVTSGLLGAVFFLRSSNPAAGLLLVLIIFFGSILIESFGVHTGLFFGSYYYEADFGPKLLGVPVTIGFAWVMVTAAAHAVAAPAASLAPAFPRLVYAVYASLCAVIMDLIIDPVAYEVKQYWIWEDTGAYYGIPFSNFAGWFILSFVFHLLISLLFFRNSVWKNTRSPFWSHKMLLLYGLMIIMFVITAAAGGLILAPILCAGLLAAVYILYGTAAGRKRI